MSSIRILNASEIERLFTLDMAVSAVERAYRQKSEGAGQVWPMVFHEFQHGVADLDIKSGDLQAEQIFGLKVVSWFGENGDKGLPALFGTSLLFDRRTGAPKALLNAGPITGLRTGAGRVLWASAVTLTPGTITVDLAPGECMVHTLDAPLGKDIESAPMLRRVRALEGDETHG